MQKPDSTIELLIPARSRDLGGFQVGRVLPFPQRRMVGPFIFLDHLGPLELPAPVPRTADVRPHPHIGLSTVTYLIDGEMTHRDSLGVEQVIRPGEVNWMTAGRGISHSERFDGMRERGGRLHGLQAWVALPDGHEEDEPSFEHYAGERLPIVENDGVVARLIAGSAFGAASGVRAHSPLFYAHLDLQAGARVELPSEYAERAAYLVSGSVEVAGRAVDARSMTVFAAGSAPVLQARERSTVMLLGGEPVGLRHVWWNFVSSSKERIEQAKHDWTTGRFALPPSDNFEHISLPDGA
jgi:redox-sensitive bicupin YhaK (pirin superfamily)